ncbi:hypothetical protein Ancab_021483 [Ancistrocladus abbreviatus]
MELGSFSLHILFSYAVNVLIANCKSMFSCCMWLSVAIYSASFSFPAFFWGCSLSAARPSRADWSSADIWSVGCTVIKMATGKPPWSQQYQEMAVFVSSRDALQPGWLLLYLRSVAPSLIKEKQKYLAKVSDPQSQYWQ